MATTGSETLDAFLATMEARRGAIVEAVVALAGPHASKSSPEAVVRQVEGQVAVWLAGLRDDGEAGFAAVQRSNIVQMRAAGVPGRLVITMIEVMRARLLDVALEALDAGVPGAADGIRRVMRLAQRAIESYDESFRKHAQEVERRGRILRELAEHAPDGMTFADPSGSMLYANPALCAALGHDVTGLSFVQVIDPPEMVGEVARQVATKGKWDDAIRFVCADGSTKRFRMVAFRAHDAQGELIARCGFLRDLTEQERAEEERQRLRERLIAAQEEALRELSTPLMPLAEGILAMPLVGAITEARAQQILETLLEGIGSFGAEQVIIDITGVKNVDAQVAGALVQAAQAARLLGAEVILSGIRAAVAQTMMELGADLGSVVTRSTLQAGVAHALGRRGRPGR